MTLLNHRFTHGGSRGTGYRVIDTETGKPYTEHVYNTLDAVRAVVDGLNEKRVAELIRNVVVYNWVDEARDFGEQDEDGQRDHIFLTLVLLARLAGMDEERIDADIALRVQAAVNAVTAVRRYSAEIDMETGDFFVYDNNADVAVDPETQYPEREDAEAEADRLNRPYVVGKVASPGVIERFATEAEASKYIEENFTPASVAAGHYYIDGPEA